MKATLILIFTLLCLNISAQKSEKQTPDRENKALKQEIKSLNELIQAYDELVFKLECELKVLKLHDSIMTKRCKKLQETVIRQQRNETYLKPGTLTQYDKGLK